MSNHEPGPRPEDDDYLDDEDEELEDRERDEE
jgi:hypothetical protein